MASTMDASLSSFSLSFTLLNPLLFLGQSDMGSLVFNDTVGSSVLAMIASLQNTSSSSLTLPRNIQLEVFLFGKLIPMCSDLTVLNEILTGIYITHFFSYVRILSYKRRNITIISGILLICAAAVGTVFGILDARNMLGMTLYATENKGQVDNELWDTMVWMRQAYTY